MSPNSKTKCAQPKHCISASLLEKQVRITLVGCGGTGSSVAAGLPYLHQAMRAWGHPRGLNVTLVDGDKISRTNCIRQPFSESEVGLYKATVLATRLNLFWGLDWQGVPEFLDEGWREETDILIGCVDTRKARRMLRSNGTYENCHYWLDIGNNADSGQFVLGQPQNSRNKSAKPRLPTIAELFPEIVDSKLDRKDKLPPCSALEALDRQEPFINQALAYQALAMLARLFRYGHISYHGGFINLQTGRMSPIRIPAAPAIYQQSHTGLNGTSPAVEGFRT